MFFIGEGDVIVFCVGEKVIYGGEGVCVIEKIDQMRMSGIKSDKEYYYLSPLYRGGTIYAPIDTPVRMRYVMSKDDAIAFIDKIPRIPAEVFQCVNVRLLSEHYQSIIKSYECEDLVKVLKSIYEKKRIAESKGKRLGTVDERYMNKVEDMLYGELAVALDIEKNEVYSFISERLSDIIE
jgi:CarD family transcriptional regulator